MEEVTIIIPTANSAKAISDTCDSLLQQKGCHWEAIFIDGGSTDRTVAIIQSYHDTRFRVQVLSERSIFARINRGLSMASGRYVQILLAGCTYLTPVALSSAFAAIAKRAYPDFFITASYVGDLQGDMHLYYDDLTNAKLSYGYQPALLQSCFFTREVFKKLGAFSTELEIRATLEFMCRAQACQSIRIEREERVYVEMNAFPKGLVTLSGLLYETWKVIYRHFGFIRAIVWLFTLKQNYHKKVYSSLWQ